VCNGLVLPDRTPEPEPYEVQKVYQRIDTTAVDAPAGRLRVRNDYDFQGLDFVQVAWDVTEDGRIVRAGRLKAPALGPKQEGELLIPLQGPAPKPGKESFLNVRYLLKTDTIWAKRGHAVAWEQIALPPGPEAPVRRPGIGSTGGPAGIGRGLHDQRPRLQRRDRPRERRPRVAAIRSSSRKRGSSTLRVRASWITSSAFVGSPWRIHRSASCSSTLAFRGSSPIQRTILAGSRPPTSLEPST
jgi:hypothetical protein